MLRVLAYGTLTLVSALAIWLAAIFFTHDPCLADDLPITIGLQLGHRWPVLAVAASPDGRTIASSSGDKTVKLWDAASGHLLRTLPGRGAVTFSPDGRTVASWSADNAIKLSDTASGRELSTLKGHADAGGAQSIAFSPDGRTIASGSNDRTVKLWDEASGRELLTLSGHTNGVASVAFSPDGRMIASGSADKTIRLWDRGTGRELRVLTGHSSSIFSVSFSPDGRTIASGSTDKTVKLWDVLSGRELLTLIGHEAEVEAVAFSPDGHAILSGSSDGTIRSWDVASGRETHRLLTGDGVQLRSFALLTDGRTVASASGKVVKLWHVVSGRLLRTLSGQADSVAAVAYSPDGQTVASGSFKNGVKLWDSATGRLLTLAGTVPESGGVAFSPDGRSIIVTSEGHSLTTLDASTGHELHTFKGHSEQIFSESFSPDGRTIASGSADRTVKLWDAETGRELHTLTGHNREVLSVSFSPDGRTIASGSLDGTVRLWEVASGLELATLTPQVRDDILSVCFSPDGHTIASGDKYGVIRFWDVAGGHGLRTLLQHPNVAVVSIAFSPDGRMLVSGGTEPALTLWDVRSGTEVRTLSGHSADVTSVSFSPTGRTLVSASWDGTIRQWGVDGQLLTTSSMTKDGEWVTVTPEGFFDSSEKGGGMLNVVHGLDVSSIDQVYDALHRPDLVREKLAGDPHGLVREATAKLDLIKVIASGRPPTVTLAAPIGTVAGSEITVAGTATDRGGGIGRVEWRVNGVTLGVDARGLTRVSGGNPVKTNGANPVVLRQSLPVQPGRNTVDVRVYNSAGLVASEPVSVEVEVDGGTRQPRLFVLAAGVDEYDDGTLRLSYSVADARALAAALKTSGAKLYSSVEITTLLNKEVTVSGLDAAFTAIGTKSAPGDVFIFYLAGHGTTVDGRYFFLPRDFRYDGQVSITRSGIGQDRWQDWLRRIPAQKSVLLYDTCDSGALTVEQVASRGLERQTALDFLTRATGRTTLTAAAGDQPALEGYGGHGVFTYALLDGLDKGDLNGDGLIDLDELITYVNRAVPEISERAFHQSQFPQVARTGGNFPLFGRISALDPQDSATANIPRTPTHVVIAAASVHREADEASFKVGGLTPGAQVRAVESAGGWMLVAKDGLRLGYLKADSVVPLH